MYFTIEYIYKVYNGRVGRFGRVYYKLQGNYKYIYLVGIQRATKNIYATAGGVQI